MKAIINDDEIELVTEGGDDLSALSRFVPPARVEVVRVGVELAPGTLGRVALRAIAAQDDPNYAEVGLLTLDELRARVLSDAARIAALEERLSRTVCFWCHEPIDMLRGADHWRSCQKHPARTALIKIYERLDNLVVASSVLGAGLGFAADELPALMREIKKIVNLGG